MTLTTHSNHNADPSLIRHLDYRTARGRLDKLERLESGSLRVPARMTRTGVLRYDGGVLEYRPPEEVFDAESLASLRSAPVTIHHPPGGEITLDTWKQFAVGHVESVRREGQFIAGDLIISDPQAIQMLESGQLVELSPGYGSRVDNREGVSPQGEAFNRVQRHIRYNHLALLPAGSGRSGSEVRVRTDSVLSARAIAAGWTPDDLRMLQELDFSSLSSALAKLAPAMRGDAKKVTVPLSPIEVRDLLALSRVSAVEAMFIEEGLSLREERQKLEGVDPENDYGASVLEAQLINASRRAK